MAAFEQAWDELREEGIEVVAGSVDPEAEARGTVQRLGLRYPVAFGLPLLPTAQALGAFYEVRRSILHATGVVVRPDGTVATACYATGPVGRLTPDDVLRVIRFWKEKAAAAG